MKQMKLFKSQKVTDKYVSNYNPPVYEPSKSKPTIDELIKTSKANRLIREIKREKNITEDERLFLLEAAKRHNIFNYEKIADYYAHSNDECKRLFEMLALVIIDYNKAIQYGYASLSEKVREKYIEEYE